MLSEQQVRLVAQAFADALDQNDFDRAASLLSVDCRYDTRSTPGAGMLIGASAIINSYRWHDQRARTAFDRVDYLSEVEEVDGSAALVRFTDDLEKDGERHTYSCYQRLSIGASGQITAIAQQEIEGQRAALDAFTKRVGVVLASTN